MKYILKKLITLIMTLFFITVITFLAFQVIPGDSALSALGMNATEEALANYRQAYGLDKSIPIQYFNWLTKVLSGDFGISFDKHIPVSDLIRDRLPVTVWLAVLSFLIILIVSLPLGIIQAKHKDKFLDRIINVFTQVGMAIPSFFLGMLISLIFGILLKWFTPGGYISYKVDFIGFIKFLVFPAIAIAVPKIAMVVKFLRNSLIRQMKLEYVRTAKSKGMKNNRVLYHHVLKNALIPVITLLAMILADILAGTIVIEQVFNIPGLGRVLLDAISKRDFPVVQMIILYIASVVVIINFLVDVIYQWIDPRVKV